MAPLTGINRVMCVCRDKQKMLTLQLRKLNIESKAAERQREQLEAQVGPT